MANSGNYDIDVGATVWYAASVDTGMFCGVASGGFDAMWSILPLAALDVGLALCNPFAEWSAIREESEKARIVTTTFCHSRE